MATPNFRRNQTRRARVAPYDSLLQATKSNGIASTFRAVFNEAFRESITPLRGEFDPHSVALYVSNRKWAERESLPTPPQCCSGSNYEQLVFECFWNSSEPTLIFLQGVVGSGKSTLIDFFLRGYCPHHPKHPTDDGAKLFLNVNCRAAQTTADLDRRIFKDIRNIIKKATASQNRKALKLKPSTKPFDVETDANFEMWLPRIDWNSEIYATPPGADERAFRLQAIRMERPHLSDEQWVDLALSHISNCIDGQHPDTNCPFGKIVMCLDNLDQSPLAVQIHAMNKVREWVDDNNWNVWRIFVPLWPSTLRTIRQQVVALPPERLINLGPLDTAELLRTRAEVIGAEITASQRSASWTDPDLNDGEPVVIDSGHCRTFVTSTIADAEGAFTDLMSRIAGGSARRELELWHRTLSSRTVYHHSHEALSGPELNSLNLRISKAYMIDGMLTGTYGAFKNDDHPLANLFAIGDSIASPRDALIGLHVFECLFRGFRSLTTILDFLRPLGYEREQIQRALDYFHAKHFFELRQHDADIQLAVNDRVVQGHEKLLHEKVYLDNMSIVTPVLEPARQEISYTTHFASVDFLARTRSTFRFLRELYFDEIAFTDARSAPSLVTQDSLDKALSEAKLPWFSRDAVARYRAHLERLRELKHGPVARVFQLNEAELFSDPVILDVGHLPRYLGREKAVPTDPFTSPKTLDSGETM